MIIWNIIIAIVVLIALGMLVWRFDPLRKYEKLLFERQPLSDNEMIQRDFSSSTIAGTIAPRVREIFAKYMQYVAEKIHPDDDLQVYWHEFDMGEMVAEIE